MIKITLFGSESTGKTTLAERLANHFQTIWVPEYSRIYQEKHNRVLTYRDVTPIAQGQMRLEKHYLAQTPNLLICDTDLLETKVYSEAYYGRCPRWLTTVIPQYYADLYLLTDIDIPWLPDGIRDRPDDRMNMHQRFSRELINRQLTYVLISGEPQKRLDTAINAIALLLSAANY